MQLRPRSPRRAHTRAPSSRALCALLGLGAIVSCAAERAVAPQPASTTNRVGGKEDIPPEVGTGLRPVALAKHPSRMVATAHPDATAAGVAVLQAGGSALDAGIAVQAMLTLVEPQSSGIGGGAFLLYWDAAKRKLYAWDGRETAPANAKPEQFLDEGGAPLDFMSAVVGGRSVGTPGVLRMLEAAHKQHGRLAWADLFAAAIARADNGFLVSERLHTFLTADAAVKQMPGAREYFYDDAGEPRPAGYVLKNPALATTLRTIATGGAQAFYEGPLAEAIVATVQGAPVSPGALSLADLRGYEAKEREPVCTRAFARKLCGFPPPTSGGVTTLQILGLYDRAASRLAQRPAAGSVDGWHLFAEAGRLAFADRDTYLADPDFVSVPTKGLLDPGYLDARAQSIRLDTANSAAAAGTPPGAPTAAWAHDESPELPSTSHFSIMDAAGNALAMTTSVENLFGSRLMVNGFFLNNQLTDFSFRPTDDVGRPIANALVPGKRPRSSMSPLIAFSDDGVPVLAIGSPGGSRIIGYTAAAALGVLEWGMNVQDAISMPKVANRNGRTEVENTGCTPADIAALKNALELRGHEVWVGDMNSGLHGVARTAEGLEGGADPRRDGVAAGD